MSENKFTPGPWYWVANNWQDTSIYGADENMLCTLSFDEEEVTEETEDAMQAKQCADARLIAAAPELLEALEVFVTTLKQADDSSWKWINLLEEHDAIGKAKAAIAKATGDAK